MEDRLLLDEAGTVPPFRRERGRGSQGEDGVGGGEPKLIRELSKLPSALLGKGGGGRAPLCHPLPLRGGVHGLYSSSARARATASSSSATNDGAFAER